MGFGNGNGLDSGEGIFIDDQCFEPNVEYRFRFNVEFTTVFGPSQFPLDELLRIQLSNGFTENISNPDCGSAPPLTPVAGQSLSVSQLLAEHSGNPGNSFQTIEVIFTPSQAYQQLLLYPQVSFADYGYTNGVVRIDDLEIIRITPFQDFLSARVDPFDCSVYDITYESDCDCDQIEWSVDGTLLGAEGIALADYRFSQPGSFVVSGKCIKNGYILGEASLPISVAEACFPEFSCFCTGENAVNIAAGAGETVSSSGLESFATSVGPDQIQFKNQCIALSGQLTVEAGKRIIFADCEIKMQPGASFFVNSEASLEFYRVDEDRSPADGDNRQGIHGCDQLWRGIILEEGTNAIGFDGGRVRIVDSHLGDAIYGIEQRHETVIDSRNTRFERNWVGIYVPSPAVSGIQNEFSTPISLFGSVGNTFSGTDQLLPKPPGYGALQISGFSRAGYLLNDCRYRVGNFFAGNTLENLQSGIEGYNVSLDVYNNTFRNTVAPWLINPVTHGIQTSEGSDVRVRPGNSFRELSFGLRSTNDFSVRFQASTIEDARVVGIGVYNPVLQSRVRIWDNPEISVATLPNAASPPGAIVVTGVDHIDELRIYDNPDVSVTSGFFPAGYPIPTAIQLIGVLAESTTDTPPIIKNNGIGITQWGTGIRIAGVRAPLVQDNSVTFSFDQTYAGTATPAGIRLVESPSAFVYDNQVVANNAIDRIEGINVRGSEAVTVCCNLLDGTRRGIAFESLCADSRIRSNELKNNREGIRAETPMTVMGQQDHPGNRFVGAFVDYAAFNPGPPFFVSLSEFRIEPPIPSPIFPDFSKILTPNAQPAQWFVVEFGNSPANCISDIGCPDPSTLPPYDDIISPFDERVIKGELDAELYGDVLGWEGRRNLYRNYDQAPGSYAGISVSVDSFLTATANGALKRIGTLERLLARYADPQDRDSLAIYVLDAEKSLAELLELDSTLAIGALDTASYWQQREAWELVLTADRTRASDVRARLEQDWQNRVEAVVPLADIYDTDPSPAIANRATVQLAYLDYTASGQLTAGQINELQAIAASCPQLQGHAVYTARNVLTMLELAATYQPTCAEPKSHSAGREAEVTGNQVYVYPSPTSGRFTLDISGLPKRPVYNLQVWSVSGQLVLTRTLSSKKGKQEIELSVESGIFYLTLTDPASGERYQQKIVVQ
jgi:hypothetical protein